MGESSQFRAGQKAPNNGVYIEVGETGSNVNDPQQIKLSAGEKFPGNSNQNRIWVNQRKQYSPGVQGRQ
ncbi:YjzC family protein [Oceanobacillus sp. CF4.6]|uniref:YjzC family protein n=1 Tax=Oceanobacillus sp. CF4.6 TaxID=3373080 RepID=UPI003EE4F6F4